MAGGKGRSQRQEMAEGKSRRKKEKTGGKGKGQRMKAFKAKVEGNGIRDGPQSMH